MKYSIFLFLWSSVLIASPWYEATPWTKSFLDIRPTASIQYLSIRKEKRVGKLHQPTNVLEGMLGISGSPYPDLEIDLFLSQASAHTMKGELRGEFQLCSDINFQPIALTAVAHATTTTRYRAERLLFWEMAQHGLEIGLGIGKHLYIAPKTYTQFFGYVFGGIGSRSSRWITMEMGVQHVYGHHRFRGAILRQEMHGNRSISQYAGLGSVRSYTDTITLGYGYTTYSGLEWKFNYLLKRFSKKIATYSQHISLSLEIPLSL